jgi:hypothetical protein
MAWQRTAFVLLAGALAAVAAHTARAAEEIKPPAQAPQFCTIKVTECVPETYTTTRTVYKTVCKTEEYDTFKCVSVPREVTRTVTTYKRVCEEKVVNRNYWVCVPVMEERTVLQTCVSYRPVTKMVTRWEDRGHYECREVPDHWASFKHRLTRRCHKNSCCEPCCEPCPTKVVKVWVPCKVPVQCPVTCMERVCETRPVTTKVCTYKKELRTEACKVACWKCVAVPETVRCTVNETQQIPVKATRTVAVCVPVEEKVTCTRLVARVVEKQVPVAPAVTECCKPACELCSQPCCESAPRCHKRHRFARGHRGGCCD